MPSLVFSILFFIIQRYFYDLSCRAAAQSTTRGSGHVAHPKLPTFYDVMKKNSAYVELIFAFFVCFQWRPWKVQN